jgi:hypothetical protein
VKPKHFDAGVRSPPLRGGEPGGGGLAGTCPEMAREVVFSEGRGLRARRVRPYTSPGYGMTSDE